MKIARLKGQAAMLPEDDEIAPSAQQEWDALPGRWRQTVERIQLWCQEDGGNFDEIAPSLVYVQHLRLLPLVHILSQHETLRQLHPFTSHALLRLSDTSATQNIIGNYPQMEALEDGSFRVLAERGNPQSGKYEWPTLFIGTAQQVVDFVAAEIVSRRTAQ